MEEEYRRKQSMIMNANMNMNMKMLSMAKVRGDAEAASATSSYRSRRPSVGSQMSFSSNRRSIKPLKSGRTGRLGKSFKASEVLEPEMIQVLNEHGKDVTPKPLVSLRPSTLHERLLHTLPERFSPESERPSAYSHTGYSISSVGSFTPDMGEEEGVEREEFDLNIRRRSNTLGYPKEVPYQSLQNVGVQKRLQLIHAPSRHLPSDQDSEKTISVTLMESETFILISLQGHVLNNTYETLKEILDRNARYKKFLQQKIGSDNFSSSHAQTPVYFQKSKEVQVSAALMESVGCQANSWDVFDSHLYKGQPGRTETLEQEHRTTISWAHTVENSSNAGIAGLLVSSGYLNSSNASASLQGSTRLAGGSMVGSQRGSLLANVAGSPSSSMAGAFSSSRRGSAATSVFPSRRGSTTGSVAGSRRGSVAGSLAPSQRGSEVGNLGGPRRSSKLGLLTVGDALLPQDSFSEGQGVGFDEAAEGWLLSNCLHSTRMNEVDIDSLPGLVKALETVERAISQNNYHEKLLLYRDFRPSEHSSGDDHYSAPKDDLHIDKSTNNSDSMHSSDQPISGVQIKWLWSFECELTKGRNISCLVWNKVNKDLLAIGYGQFEFGAQKDGLIAFWSLKNPCYPHATIPTLSGVMALDFSSSNANFLAVGFYNGNVAIYDAKNPKDPEPVTQSGFSSGKHNDPVWKVQWIDSNSEHVESLVSISTDGRVTQWTLKKDLEYVNLMTLKRVASHSKGAQPQPFISRHAAGMCFDFCPRDPSVYLVGTEEGIIYKCSRSYNEQYLQTFVGHTGPVFQVRWSPFLSYLFLSCSSDWTVRLWHEEQDTAILVFQTAYESVGDVRWSLTNACVFGTIFDDGRLEVWDLAISALKPVVIYEDKRRLTCLLFSEDSPVVVSASNDGSASVFRMVGLSTESYEEEVSKLQKALAANISSLPDFHPIIA